MYCIAKKQTQKTTTLYMFARMKQELSSILPACIIYGACGDVLSHGSGLTLIHIYISNLDGIFQAHILTNLCIIKQSRSEQ